MDLRIDYALPAVFWFLAALVACGDESNSNAQEENEARLRAANADVNATLNSACSHSNQCRYVEINGICGTDYRPYSTATTDEDALRTKVEVYELLLHAAHQGLACPAVVMPPPPPLACNSGRCG